MKRLLILFFAFGISGLHSSLSGQDQIPVIYSADTVSKAVELYDEGQYEEALNLFNLIQPGDTNYALAIYEKSLALSELERFDEAAEAASLSIILNDSTDALGFNSLGSAYNHSGNKEKALEIYELGIRKFPMDHLLYYNRAVVYSKYEEYDKMLDDLKRAIEINPFHASSHYYLAGLAINEEQYAQALLSLGYALMIEPKTKRANNSLVYYNDAVSTKTELEPKNIILSSSGDDFKKIDLLIKNYVALTEKYDVDSKVKLPLIKQMYLTYEQSSKKKKYQGFWENYYLPFYKRLLEEDHFEAFSYLILLSSGNEQHQKVISKNSDDIDEFISWGGSALRSIHGLHHKNYDPGQEKIRYWFSDRGTSVEAVGKVNTADNPIGNYKFFYSDGALLSKGEFSDKSLRTGPWKYYHQNGQLSKDQSYNEDKINGRSLEYFDDGSLRVEATYKDGTLSGVTNVYDEKGYLTRSMFHKNDQIEDSLVYYYPHGQKSAYLPMKAGIIEGKANYYNAVGNRSSYINFANDERNGPFEAFFYDGTLSVKGNYLNGYYDGPYESYYPNGKLESKGVYKEGVQVGAWESYYYDGTLKSKASYDERGKQNGSQEKYDPNGKRELLYEYSKGEITAYTYFDKDGAILKKAERKKGKFWYEGYTLEGVKTIEGNYVGDHKDGHWKYYTTNGELDAEEDYNEEGQIIGEYKGYYPSGQLYQLRHFRKDTLHGYERMYHLNGNIKSEGNYVKGKAHGQWNHYFRDGALSYTNYYAAGKLNGPQYYYDPEGKLYMIKHFEMGSLASTASTNADSSVYKTVYSKGPEAMEAFYLPNGVAHSILPMVGGEYNGKALWKYGTGQLKCEGQYINDNRHGEWKWYHANGKPDQTGAYFTGTKIGQWNGFFTSGKPKYIAHYENGQMHGEYTRYYENGNLDYKVNYNQGEMDGKRYFYDYKGHTDHIRFYDNGRVIGYAHLDASGNELSMIPLPRETGEVISYFPNGKVSRKYTYDHGRLSGVYEEFHDNGTQRYHVVFDKDEKEGAETHYYENGKVMYQYQYKHGDLNGEAIHYHPNGKLKSKEYYLNDLLHGWTEEYDENGKLLHKYRYCNGVLYEKA